MLAGLVLRFLPVLSQARLLAANISVGEHPQAKWFGMTVDLDTIWATAVAGIVVMAIGLALRARATSGVPGKLQLVWELGVEAVQRQVESSIGPRGARVVPLAVTLFVFILVANWFEAFDLGSKYEFLPAPTGDINLPLAMSFFVIILVHMASVRTRGLVGYVRHYVLQPFPWFLFPVNVFINVVEEVAKPITLALRLFGNMLSGGLMLALLAALVAWHIFGVPVGYGFVVVLNPVCKAIDMGIGAIQAFIFALSAILYFDMAMREEH